MGPQLGYYYPEIVLEADLHGPGINAQGAFVPGGWPVHAARAHEGLRLEPHLREQRQPRPVPREALRARRLGARRARRGTTSTGASACRWRRSTRARSAASRRSSRSPCTARCPAPSLVGGKPYAIARQRSTYGEEALSLAALRDMTTRPRRRPSGASGTRPTSSASPSTGATRTATPPPTSRPASSRAARRGTNKLLPTLGTGNYDWRGFISQDEHPHDVGGPGRAPAQLEQQARARLADR